MILMVGYSVGLLAGLAAVVPPGGVVVAEEPDVARVRALHQEVARIPLVSRLVECEYQVPGALTGFLDASGLRPAAIVPGIEYAVEAAASAAAHLALPGAGVEAAAVFRDKHRLRHLAEAAGLRNPRHALVATPAEAASFLAATGGRCVLKPTTRQGSLGVQYVESAAQIEAGWAMTSHPEGGAVIPSRGIPSLVLAEEAVTGPEFSVEMLVRQRVPCFVNVTAKHLFPGRFPVERGHDVPAPLPGDEARLLAGATATLARAAGVSDGILHGEWILRDGEPVLVECAARAPGDRIAELIRLAYGFPLIPAYLDVMLGNRPPARPAAMGGAAVRYLTARPGVVVAVAGAGEAAGMPGVTEVRVRARTGDVVRPLTVSGNRLGYVLARGEDPLDAAANAEAAAALIQVTTGPGTGSCGKLSGGS
jgi:biotin carboxylase